MYHFLGFFDRSRMFFWHIVHKQMLFWLEPCLVVKATDWESMSDWVSLWIPNPAFSIDLLPGFRQLANIFLSPILSLILHGYNYTTQTFSHLFLKRLFYIRWETLFKTRAFPLAWTGFLQCRCCDRLWQGILLQVWVQGVHVFIGRQEHDPFLGSQCYLWAGPGCVLFQPHLEGNKIYRYYRYSFCSSLWWSRNSW